MTRIPSLARCSSAFVFVLQLLVWWGANSAYALDVEFFFRRFRSRSLCADLTFVQSITGIIVGALMASWSYTDDKFDRRTIVPSFGAIPLAVGMLHTAATVLTNASYSLIGSTSTLVWKLTEPLATIALNYAILREKTPGVSIVGVLTLLAGVLSFSRSSFGALSFSPIILANIMFPTRNVLLKLEQKRDKTRKGGAIRFVHMLALGMPFATAAIALKMMTSGITMATAPYLIRNALLFSAYQFASISLLEKLDTLTHSLFNTIKRFSGIIVSMVVLNAPILSNHIDGFCLTVLGFWLYLKGRAGKAWMVGRSDLLKAAAGIIIIWAMRGFLMSLSAPAESESAIHWRPTVTHVTFKDSAKSKRPDEGKQIPSLPQAREKPELTQNQTYVIYLMNLYEPRNYSYSSYEESLKDNGGNVGNMVWQYAAHKQVAAISKPMSCTIFRLCKEHPLLADGARIIQYSPRANSLEPDVPERFSGTLRGLNGGIDTTLMIGLGIQMNFDLRDPSFDLHPGKKILVRPEHYVMPENQKKLLSVLQNRSTPILLRGDFSLRVTQLAGYTLGISAGCPSLFINEDIQLGLSMEQKYRRLASRIGDTSLKVAINIKPAPLFQDLFLALLEKYPNSFIYAQGEADLKDLLRAGVPFSRVRIFPSVEEWQASLRTMDVSFGPRIHGNMMALGAGIPAFVVALDHRVLELVQRMKIPYKTSYDRLFNSTDLDVAELASHSDFNGEAFDVNRCEIAKIYVETFSRYGLGVQPHVMEISKLC